MRHRRLLLILNLLFLTVGIDQLTKIIVRRNLPLSYNFHYFYNTVIIEHAENSGAFLSMGSSLGNDTRFWIFTISVALFLAVALVLLLKKKEMGLYNTIAVTLLIAGGLGNLIDRFFRGTVTDFMNLGLGPLRTGIFNIADMAIVAGVGLLLFASFKPKKHEK